MRPGGHCREDPLPKATGELNVDIAVRTVRRFALPFAIPVIIAFALVVLVRDPTYRFPLLVLLLPLFQRRAALAAGVYEMQDAPSRLALLLHTLGFAGSVVGWMLVFTVVSFTIAVGVLSYESTSLVMKRSILLGALGFVVAAWFWWPYYARHVVSSWPRHDHRIWVESSNRWEELFGSYRMQRMLKSGTTRWLGFSGVAGLVVLIIGVSVLGVYEGPLPRVMEILAVTLLLPALHYLAILKASELCVLWSQHAGVAS